MYTINYTYYTYVYYINIPREDIIIIIIIYALAHDRWRRTAVDLL